MTIIILLAIALAISLFVNYMASRKRKSQDKDITRLIKEGSIMSNKLRLKGIEVDVLKKRIKKAERDFNIRIVG